MTGRLFALCSLLLVLLLVAGCPCSEQDCRTQYGLKKCSECPPIPGPDGPDVGLGPVLNQLVWTVGGTAATAGPSVWAAGSRCKLSEDFIGKTLIQFMYVPSGESHRVAEIIELENANTLLRIKKTSGNAIDWWIKDKTSTPPKQCTIVSSGLHTSTIPSEFLSFTTSDRFEEVSEGKTVESIEHLQVQQ